MLKTIAFAPLALALLGCNIGFVHDERLAGPYRLVAIDIMEQMSLCRDVGSDGDCSGDGLGGETVFAAGANDRFITLAIHPGNDRSRTNYYYIVRSPREAEDGGEGAILKGPFDRRTFAEVKARAGLPEFSKVFDELK